VTLRVAYLGHSAQPSGAELGLVDLIACLEGVEPRLVLAEDGPLVELVRERGIAVEVLPLAASARSLRRRDVRPGSLRAPLAAAAAAAYVPRLAALLRRRGTALVHANTLKSLIYGLPAARLARLPVVWHVHDRIADDYLPRAAVRLVRFAGRHVDAVIANSETTLASVGRLGVPAAVVHPPVTLPAREPRSRGPQPFAAAIVGRLAPWKGQHVFLRAFAEAFPRGPERAVVVGSPLFGETDYERSLHELVRDLDLGGRVEFRGFRKDVARELERVDAVVHASVLPEPFGRVVVEGMAAGLPVVATRAGGPAEVLTHEVDGLLYPMGDVGALARALTRLAGDERLRLDLGRAGTTRAESYRPEAAARSVEAVYRAVLERRR
jgi:glycosyltransferase involved in cell wall biosynthesis